MMIKNLLTVFTALFLLISATACIQAQSLKAPNLANNENTEGIAKATFGAGCFWCVEAIFQQLKGVKKVVAGYAGGHVKNPTYRQVSTGTTGHTEVARIAFDPSVISYETLLTVFWHSHNPTTLNRQGADVGPQYRSVIFYHNENQKKIAIQSHTTVEKSDLWKDPIVTVIEPLANFSIAEDYHQNYFKNNPTAAYCSVVIAPKIKKLKKEFPNLLKDEVK